MRLGILLSLAVLIEILATPLSAAVFLVDTTTDQVDASPGDGICLSSTGNCSLRAAVMETNALPGEDVVEVPAGIYQLDLRGPSEDLSLTGDLDILDDLVLRGLAQPEDVILQGSGDRILHSADGTTLSASSMTVRRGFFQGRSPSGGANILAEGDLTLEDVVIAEGALPSGSGAGLLSLRSLVMEDCEVSDNTTGSFFSGASAISHQGPTLQIVRSEFHRNRGSRSTVSTTAAQVAIVASVFANNSNDVEGRGVFHSGAGSTSIVDTVFQFNGGGLTLGGDVYMEEVSILGGAGRVSIGGDLFADGFRIEGVARHSSSPYPKLFLGGDASLSRSVFRNNAAGHSTIVQAVGILSIVSSEISGNESSAIKGHVAEIVNSTISGNTITRTQLSDPIRGAAIEGDVGAMVNSTIIDNDNEALGGTGGGVSGSIAFMKGSILAGNRAATDPDCSGSFVSGGYNIIGNGDGCAGTPAPTDLVGTAAAPVDPRLAQLAHNGGDTLTHRPLLGSPALNAIPSEDCAYEGRDPTQPVNILETDQRGVSRPVQGACEIGAFEGPPANPLPLCGLGPELALVLPLLGFARRLRPFGSREFASGR